MTETIRRDFLKSTAFAMSAAGILAASTSNGTAQETSDKIPVPKPRERQVDLPAASLVEPLQADSSQLYFQNGFLELPKYNHISLPAPERAILMSLRTEQRDTAGNILLGNEGKPIMVHVKEGMYVYEGQILGHFDDRELKKIEGINEAQLEVARSERDKQIEVEYAAKGVQVADHEVRTMEEGNARLPKTFPQIEVLKAKLAFAQALANYDLQKYNIEDVKTREVVVREKELERTRVQIEIRQLIAPIDGMIVKIVAAEGEWKREGDPVLEIMQLNTMRVKVDIDPNQYAIHELDGKRATVLVPLARGKTETFQGTVVVTDPTIGGNLKYPVYIEVPNKRVGNYWVLQPGRHGVDVRIHL